MQHIWDKDFEASRKDLLLSQASDLSFKAVTKDWLQKSVDHKYSYQFNWLGVPIIQMPSDIVVFQEIVYKTRPDLIIETGVARGGSLIFWASIQKLCGIEGRVLGIDIDIRPHAVSAINSSIFSDQIKLIQGGSTDQVVANEVLEFSKKFTKVMVVLDSNHTHEHVLEELNMYADLVSKDSLLLVLDTVIDDLEVDPSRSWGPGASPKTAVLQFMEDNPGKFVNASEFESKSLLSVAPQGFWLRV